MDTFVLTKHQDCSKQRPGIEVFYTKQNLTFSIMHTSTSCCFFYPDETHFFRLHLTNPTSRNITDFFLALTVF